MSGAVDCSSSGGATLPEKRCAIRENGIRYYYYWVKRGKPFRPLGVRIYDSRGLIGSSLNRQICAPQPRGKGGVTDYLAPILIILIGKLNHTPSGDGH